MTSRIIMIILDSVGAGYLPDAEKYGDVGANTLSHVAKARNGLNIPNLIKLGIGNIEGVDVLQQAVSPAGCFGKMAELSAGKDTTTGHWELMGIHTKTQFPVYPNGFPEEIIERFIKECNLPGILGNYPASGTEIIELLGKEHMETRKPIIYTSADSVFQIACHEEIYPIEEIYEMCRKAREILTGEYNVGRVIARPFIGSEGHFERTYRRRDYSIAPDKDNLMVRISESGREVAGVGKIEDIFAGVGLTKAVHTKDNMDGIDKTLDMMDTVESGFIFTNLVEFDSKWGHRNDYEGYGRGLEDFDARLTEILDRMKSTDILMITADHGCDPTTAGTDHTREYVPLLLYGHGLKKGVDLGIRATFADAGQTIADIFGLSSLRIGKSFKNEIFE
ncbi:phosphopentomutase [Parasporobacterium paucivorans]|uniref:Phosphopentomutase n=1 Tax=Parasporobacterium paucivorans DSM 15970 TaxID=1122934 RepID=A0A1M6F871_9FIRM|nr:phosphopentomutase [Parasporobacterium paucivorans]SHI93873.1 phosphopentomutase [Parasporobacterium paucivorans DSM 15970]